MTRLVLQRGLIVTVASAGASSGKLLTVPTAAIGAVVGQLEAAALTELPLALRSWLALN